MNFQKVPLAPGLYFVGVPIGTARDITLRALDVLASADVLAAEDTRSLRKLMEIHGVPLGTRRIVAMHDHSGEKVVQGLLDQAKNGLSIAYASEAGMPLIADPGFELSRAAAQTDVMQTCAPGPSAVLTALVLAGLPTDSFHFAGFLPNAQGARRSALQDLAPVRATLAFYESPKRISACLRDAGLVLGGDRQAVVCRELTKKFEELRRGTLDELSEYYASVSVKGEIVLLIDRGDLPVLSETDLEMALTNALADMSMRDAVDAVSQAHDAPRRQVYQLALKLGKDA